MRNTRKMLLLSGGAGIFAQANPQTGTLYTGTSDGVFVWTLSYPASPDYLDQLRGGWRVQDLQSGGLGLVNNGWEWRLEYQTNGTWTFTWYSVTTGTAAAAIYTQANIGTVTNIRVTLSGTSITVESSSNNGSSYTARGNTTSATHQSNAGISASYTGATGSQLLDNPDFSTWTGTHPNAYPTGWTLGSQTAARYVEQNANGVRFVSDNNFTPVLRQNGAITIGLVYLRVIVFHSTASGRLWSHDGANGGLINPTSAGTYAARWAAVGTDPLITVATTPIDLVAKTDSIWQVGILDSTGDGGFSLVEAA